MKKLIAAIGLSALVSCAPVYAEERPVTLHGLVPMCDTLGSLQAFEYYMEHNIGSKMDNLWISGLCIAYDRGSEALVRDDGKGHWKDLVGVKVNGRWWLTRKLYLSIAQDEDR